MRLTLLLCGMLIPLAGCTPYVSLNHYSDPTVSNDGGNWACLGGKKSMDRLHARIAGCHEIGSYRMIAVEIEYDLIKNARNARSQD